MPSLSSSGNSIRSAPRSLRLGFVALTDAAPFAVAESHGKFAARGLNVELHREIGWATLRDKIIYGELDAAQAPAPMLWSVHAGIHCPSREVLTAFVLSRNGNAITLSRRLWDSGVRDPASLGARALEGRRRRTPLTFGVVFPFSSHHLLLRAWLREAGIDPDRDVRIVVVPPGQVFRNLAAGTIDGFCVGEPWNTLAVRERVGWCPVCSALQQPGHVEKVLMVTRDFAERRAPEHRALVAALVDSCRWCDEPQNREALADLLSARRYLNTPAAVVAPALVGSFDFGHRTEHLPDFHVFHRGDANEPAPDQAAALQTSLVESGLLPAADAPADLPRRLFRSELYREFVSHHARHQLASNACPGGVRSES